MFSVRMEEPESLVMGAPETGSGLRSRASLAQLIVMAGTFDGRELEERRMDGGP